MGSRWVGKLGKIISFELIPLNCKTIKVHLSANNIDNVIIESLVVSKDVGKYNFQIKNNNANSHMESVPIRRQVYDLISTIKVNSISLDDYILHQKIIPDVIKVGVESAEKLVLQGSTKLLKDFDAD